MVKILVHLSKMTPLLTTISARPWGPARGIPRPEGRNPHCHFQGLLRLYSRYGRSDRSAAQGDLCHEAPTLPVTRRDARQLADQSTTLWVGSPSTSDSRLRGARPTAGIARRKRLWGSSPEFSPSAKNAIGSVFWSSGQSHGKSDALPFVGFRGDLRSAVARFSGGRVAAQP
jgi:hypothetical protein